MKLLASVLLLACACGCSNKDSCEDIENREARSQCLAQRNASNSPTPVIVPVVQSYTIEYRVIGTASRADITYASDIYGSTDVSTGIPWFANFKTTNNRVFVSLFARSQDSGTIRIQILVNGVLFREASTDGFFGTSVEVSGTVVNPLTSVNQVRK